LSSLSNMFDNPTHFQMGGIKAFKIVDDMIE